MRVMERKLVIEHPTNNEKIASIASNTTILSPTPDTPIGGLKTHFVNSS